MKNRGLAKSWNDAIQMSQNYGDEFCIIANDDIKFKDGGFVSFVDFVRNIEGDYGLATVLGQEGENSSHAGQAISQEFACGVIGKKALREIGFLDQNFTPAYFEDTDYIYRMRLAGLTIALDERVLVEHERSKTMRSSSEAKGLVSEASERNRKLFIEKWGGDFHSAHFKRPFNDQRNSIYISYEDSDHPYYMP